MGISGPAIVFNTDTVTDRNQPLSQLFRLHLYVPVLPTDKTTEPFNIELIGISGYANNIIQTDNKTLRN